MRFDEIKVGEHYQEGSQEDYGDRVEVLEVGTFETKVYSGSRDWSGHKTTKKGALVQLLQRDGSPLPDGASDSYKAPKWVESRRLHQTWSNYEAIQQRKLNGEKSAKELSRKLTEAFEDAGLKGSVYYSTTKGIVVYGLQSANLLEVLAKAAAK